MGFYRQDYWSEVPCFPPGDLPNPGIEPISLTSPALPDGFFTTSATTYPNVKRLFPCASSRAVMRHQLSFVIKARKLTQNKTQTSGLVGGGGPIQQP